MIGSLHGPPSAHPGSSSSYDNGFPTGDHELFTTFSWDDQKVRRVFIRKVTAFPNSPGLGGWVGEALEKPLAQPSAWKGCLSPLLLWSQLTAPVGNCFLRSHPPAPCYTSAHCLLSRYRGPPFPVAVGYGPSLLPFSPHPGSVPMTPKKEGGGTACGSGE